MAIYLQYLVTGDRNQNGQDECWWSRTRLVYERWNCLRTFQAVFFFCNKISCVRKFHETRAECLRELRVYILYMCVYTVNKGFVCSIAPGFYSHCQHECGGG